VGAIGAVAVAAMPSALTGPLAPVPLAGAAVLGCALGAFGAGVSHTIANHHRLAMPPPPPQPQPQPQPHLGVIVTPVRNLSIQGWALPPM